MCRINFKCELTHAHPGRPEGRRPCPVIWSSLLADRTSHFQQQFVITLVLSPGQDFKTINSKWVRHLLRGRIPQIEIRNTISRLSNSFVFHRQLISTCVFKRSSSFDAGFKWSGMGQLTAFDMWSRTDLCPSALTAMSSA